MSKIEYVPPPAPAWAWGKVWSSRRRAQKLHLIRLALGEYYAACGRWRGTEPAEFLFHGPVEQVRRCKRCQGISDRLAREGQRC